MAFDHSQALDDCITLLFQESNAIEYGLSLAEFARLLFDTASKYLGPDTDAGEFLRLYRTLHIGDLVLMQACAAGNASAWELLIHTYRPKLRQAALMMTRDHDAARELADSLFGELFGAAGKPKLLSFTGRGSLEGWLKATLAQSYIDRYRVEQRLIRLDDHKVGSRAIFPASFETEVADSRLERAVAGALAELGSSDRLLLTSYFFDRRTLAEIGRMIHVHESTVSRRVRKVTKTVRKKVIRSLLESGLDRREVNEMIDSGAWRISLDIEKLIYGRCEAVQE
ncbi:MAG: sigma-70 family RNA polymerase sigma factor [Acidobacteriaceae bacterium]|nr:sigma-70 family RNA polymerase sigma factor [Acidobacteriaceae bacterium]